jgi:hypothetical protein
MLYRPVRAISQSGHVTVSELRRLIYATNSGSESNLLDVVERMIDANQVDDICDAVAACDDETRYSDAVHMIGVALTKHLCANDPRRIFCGDRSGIDFCVSSLGMNLDKGVIAEQVISELGKMDLISEHNQNGDFSSAVQQTALRMVADKIAAHWVANNYTDLAHLIIGRPDIDKLGEHDLGFVARTMLLDVRHGYDPEYVMDEMSKRLTQIVHPKQPPMYD